MTKTIVVLGATGTQVRTTTKSMKKADTAADTTHDSSLCPGTRTD